MNFLHPIDRTPLGDREPPAGRCLRALALFRLTNRVPRSRCGQPGAAWAVRRGWRCSPPTRFVDGYLTTAGQAPDAAAAVEALGFQVEDSPALLHGAAGL